MNLSEARSILELSEDASLDDTKKKYRELTKKYHPDVNKDPGAEDRFKKINEAYSYIQSGKGSESEEFINPFNINPFGNRRNIVLQPIHKEVIISFQESVTGCKREVSYSRKVRCSHCHGQGVIILNNGCDKCHGSGQINGKQGHMMFTRTCDKCGGKVPTKVCDKCNSSGALDAETSIQVTIPGGVITGNVLRLSGMGHFMCDIFGMEQNSDAFVLIKVTPDSEMSLDGKDVVSYLNISLLNALQGCSRKVRTVFGDKDIIIPTKSKNKQEIIIPTSGVSPNGNHRVILNVEYPENINNLIDVLSKEEN